jgi:hypothetical protein
VAVKFSSYIEDNRHKPFSWGTQDCLHFVNSGVDFQTGNAFEDQSLWDYNTEFGAVKAMLKFFKKHGVKDILEFFDSKYQRVDHLPQRGSIVAVEQKEDTTIGYRLGFVVSYRGAFVGEDGLLFLPLNPKTDFYWKVK